MSYEMFQKGAALNSQFEVIPTKLKLLSEGIILDDNGYIKYDGKTYVTNMVKLEDLPTKLQALFIENKFSITKPRQDSDKIDNKLPALKINSSFEDLGKTLFEQLQNIVDPEKNTDLNKELKKANAVCNIADKLITIMDLSLKAEILHEKKQRKFKNIYD